MGNKVSASPNTKFKYIQNETSAPIIQSASVGVKKYADTLFVKTCPSGLWISGIKGSHKTAPDKGGVNDFELMCGDNYNSDLSKYSQGESFLTLCPGSNTATFGAVGANVVTRTDSTLNGLTLQCPNSMDIINGVEPLSTISSTDSDGQPVMIGGTNGNKSYIGCPKGHRAVGIQGYRDKNNNVNSMQLLCAPQTCPNSTYKWKKEGECQCFDDVGATDYIGTSTDSNCRRVYWSENCDTQCTQNIKDCKQSDWKDWAPCQCTDEKRTDYETKKQYKDILQLPTKYGVQCEESTRRLPCPCKDACNYKWTGDCECRGDVGFKEKVGTSTNPECPTLYKDEICSAECVQNINDCKQSEWKEGTSCQCRDETQSNYGTKQQYRDVIRKPTALGTPCGPATQLVSCPCPLKQGERETVERETVERETAEKKVVEEEHKPMFTNTQISLIVIGSAVLVVGVSLLYMRYKPKKKRQTL